MDKDNRVQAHNIPQRYNNCIKENNHETLQILLFIPGIYSGFTRLPHTILLASGNFQTWMPCSDLFLQPSTEQTPIISEFEINGSYEKSIIGGKERENPWRDDIYN